MVPTLKSVSAEAVEVESSAPGDEDLVLPSRVVVEALEVVAPGSVLVKLVEDEKARRRQLPPQDGFPMLGDVPVQIALPTWRGPPTNTIFSSRSARI